LPRKPPHLVRARIPSARTTLSHKGRGEASASRSAPYSRFLLGGKSREKIGCFTASAAGVVQNSLTCG